MVAFLPCALPLAFKADWSPLPPMPSPPRSGHASAACPGGALLFGGYGEPPGGSTRDVVNDLLQLNLQDKCWSTIAIASAGRSESAAPGPRLASALAKSGSSLILFGGWDPQTPGTGGVILDDVWSLDLPSLSWSRLGSMPEGPTSRHVAVDVGGVLIVHTFRCSDAVLVWDVEKKQLRSQPTTGPSPSSRGLHAAAAADDRTLVVCCGAAKDGGMMSDAYALDIDTWVWTQMDCGDHGGGPSARAGACAAGAPRGERGIVLFGGAEAGEGGSLVPRGDVWILSLGGEGKGTWTKLLEEGEGGKGEPSPRPRNAATLVKVGDGEYLMSGGWRPFVETYQDSYILQVTKT